MELNDSDDLIKFINKETKTPNQLDLTYAYKIFCRSLPKIISLLYKKIYYIENINSTQVVTLGSNMFHNIYWFVLRYTNNCDVALFLSETSINLLLESIVSSYQTVQDNPFKIMPNISDSIRFAYKKTIGPLQTTIPNNKSLDNPQIASSIIKMFIVQITNQILINQILPSSIKNELNKIGEKDIKIPPRVEILVDFIQNQNKTVIQSVWHIIYYIIDKNSEKITDKLYYQINHYVNTYCVNDENKNIKFPNEMEWVNYKQKQITQVYNNVNSLVETIKDFGESL